MKKIMIVAMLFAGTVSTFAGDSPALKAILSIGTYDEAVKAVKANVNTLLNNEEKAKAYDHLVELAKKDYNAQSEISDKNTVYKQMGQNSKIVPFDTLKMGNAAVNVIENALLRYKYDNMPNEKGKIKPKYDGDKAVVYAIRTNLVNIAGGYWNNNNKLFEKFTGAYLDSKNEPFFAGIDTTAEKTFLGQFAYLASYVALQNKEYDKVERWVPYAERDEKYAKDAFSWKLEAMEKSCKTREDSVNYKNKLQALFNQRPNDQTVFARLYGVTSALDGNAAGEAMLEGVLAKDPKNFVALFYKGQDQFDKRKYDDAVKTLKAAAEANPTSPFPWFYIAACYQNKAADAKVIATANVLLEEAIKNYDKCKELDPKQQQMRWGQLRYNAYYARYGADDAKTKAAEADKY